MNTKIIKALHAAQTRLELNDCEGEEAPFIDQIDEALTTLQNITPHAADFAFHARAIECAQGYATNPEHWNPPTPEQVAHLLALSGISTEA
jgi:hypothetical protein